APVDGARGRVIEAMRYVCLGGGKRLRPFLVWARARLFDVDEDQALRVGAALEMVHCYSLIHDDLPAMDDSDLRRGRPSVHKAFDEATAILAGDGLLTYAFEVLAAPATHADAEVRVGLVAALAQAAGAAGMVGGQMIDIAAERDALALDLQGISELQALKTGALIRFGCEAGAILGQASAADRAALTGYAADLGLAFQIVDDLLDALGDETAIGKPVGQDAAMDKSTFVKLLGVEGARNRAEALAASACARLDPYPETAEPLRSVARFVLTRTS
ncbi:MAG: polyprenyl synthetase family protein, partial [Maricaulaceae bacterium]